MSPLPSPFTAQSGYGQSHCKSKSMSKKDLEQSCELISVEYSNEIRDPKHGFDFVNKKKAERERNNTIKNLTN